MDKVMLFTHTDLDGIGCAILAYLAFGRENVDVEYCNYKDVDEKVREFWDSESVDEYDKVFITDISLSEDLAGDIDFDNVDEKCLLFDHHATALWMNRYGWCDVELTDATAGWKTSGTELFYSYLSEQEYFDSLFANAINNIYEFVSIVRDYDTWRWKELGEEGVVCKQVNDLFYIYGREKFIEGVIDSIQYNSSFPVFNKFDRFLLDQKQHDIDIYVAGKNEQIVESVDQFGHKYGIVFAERYFSELGNRLCELNPKLDYVAMIDISRGVVSYRTVRDNLDLGGEIAHAYGGGGHPKAAGSTFDGDAIRDALTGLIFSKEAADDGLNSSAL